MPREDEVDIPPMPTPKKPGGKAGSQGQDFAVGVLDKVAAYLPVEFFERMERKGTRSVAEDFRWVLDHELQFRGLLARWDMQPGPGWDAIYELLNDAPGKGAITLLQQMVENRKDTLPKVYQALGKLDDEDEDAKRQRLARERFTVIGKLLDVGRPKPLWLSDDWRLLDGVGEE